MFAEEMRRAVLACERRRLPELAAAVWKGFGAGAIGEDAAQQLAELIEARKVVPIAAKPQPRRVGSRPRSTGSLERRRRLVASGWMPPQIAAQFTMAEAAVLVVIAQEVVKGRGCRLTIGMIAALAGCCKQTVRNAVRQAQGLGLLVSEEWRLSAFRSAPNHVRILSPEWLSWLRLAARRAYQGGGSKTVEPTHTQIHKPARFEPRTRRMEESFKGKTARSRPQSPCTISARNA